MDPSIIQRVLGREEFVGVDVGAARGLLPHWVPLGSIARLYLFEPDRDAIPGIEAALHRVGARATIVPKALSKSGGTQTLHVHAAQSGSSLLDVRVPYVFDHCREADVFPIRDVPVPTETFAAALDALAAPRVDIVKLDTQGTELSILESLDGARRDQLLSVELEVGTPGTYEGQASFADISTWMTRHGLELFDLAPKRAPLLRRDGKSFERDVFGTFRNAPSVGQRLYEVDAYFFRAPGPMLDAGDGGSLRRLAVAYATYGFFSHAYRLIESAEERGVQVDGAEDARAAIVAWHRSVAQRRTPIDVAEKALARVAARLRLR